MNERRASAGWVGVGFLLLLVGPAVSRAADAELSFKRRGDVEKRFVARAGEAIVKAAHMTAKKIDLVNYKYSNPKPNRTELAIKMEYHGVASGKRYLADILLKIDSTDKAAWEVLNIDYSDNNSIPYNGKKIQALIKDFNQ